jgi:DNA-binding FadR family transcriptional regulator
MTLEFEKVAPTRVFQNVVDQIQEAIFDGRLKAGDQLPPEMKLKEMFQTGRGTIREALRVLEQKGLVEIRTGAAGGAVVRAPDASKIAESLDLLVQCRTVTFDQLAQFRQEVEGAVAALAASAALKSDIERLVELLEEARGLLESDRVDPKLFSRIDVRIHIAVAEIVGNPLFVAVLRMVHENVLEAFERFSLSPDLLRANFRDLDALVSALKKGDADRARETARAHVKRFNRHLKKQNQDR